MTASSDIDAMHWNGIPFVGLDVRHWGYANLDDNSLERNEVEPDGCEA